MIDEQTVVTYLTQQLAYSIELAEDILPNWQDIIQLPSIFVGYAAIDSRFPNVPTESSLFNTNGENLVQSFEIQIVSTRDVFRSTWIEVYNALIGWNPIEAEAYHSGFTYAQGGKMGRSHNKIWHVDIWRIGFPTNHVLV